MSRTGPRKADLPAVKTNYPADIFDRELTNEEMEEYIKSVERSIKFMFDDHFLKIGRYRNNTWSYSLNNYDSYTWSYRLNNYDSVSVIFDINNRENIWYPKFYFQLMSNVEYRDIKIMDHYVIENDLTESFGLINKLYDSIIQHCKDIISNIGNTNFDSSKLSDADKEICIRGINDIHKVLEKITGNNIDIKSDIVSTIRICNFIEIRSDRDGLYMACRIGKPNINDSNRCYEIFESYFYRDNIYHENFIISIIDTINKFLKKCTTTCAELIEHFEKQKNTIFRQE